MPVPSTLRGISATAANNSPAGTDVIGSSLDDYLRSIQSVFRQYLASAGSNIASATTTDLSTADGFWVTITGTTTITGLGTEQAGIWYGIKFSGALTLTHNATSLILPGAANITTAAGDSCLAESLGSGNWKIHAYQKASGTAIAPTPLRSYLSGCTLSTAGSSATMSVAAGIAVDSTTTSAMILAAISKTTSSWSVGSGNGGLDTGSIANATWYHFYVIQRVDTGVVDVVFSTNASSPTMPANYTLYRRIGSGLTNGSAQWTSFVQYGDRFEWLANVQNVATTNPGTSAITPTLTTPLGVKVLAWISSVLNNQTSSGSYVLFTDPSQTDSAATNAQNSYAAGGNGASNQAGGEFYVMTNTSSQIRYRLSQSGASDVMYVNTRGWIDRRGQDA